MLLLIRRTFSKENSTLVFRPGLNCVEIVTKVFEAVKCKEIQIFQFQKHGYLVKGIKNFYSQKTA